MKKVVVSGGDIGGKTTLIAEAKQQYPGKVQVVPEQASALMREALPVLGKDLSVTAEVLATFQQVMQGAQIPAEDLWSIAGVSRGAELLLCDRGTGDLAAYTPGGWEELTKVFGQSKESLLCRYSAVIYLRSLAWVLPERYTELIATNPQRTPRSVEEARSLCDRTLGAWQGHPNLIVIDDSNFEKRRKHFMQALENVF